MWCVSILPNFDVHCRLNLYCEDGDIVLHETLEELVDAKQLNLETQNFATFFGILTPESDAACFFGRKHKHVNPEDQVMVWTAAKSSTFSLLINIHACQR
jgi:hypothetical protein